MLDKDCEEIGQLEVKGLGLVSAGYFVKHGHFGIGEVEGVYQFSSGQNSIRINFERHGSKALVPEYANLQPHVKKHKLFRKLKYIFK